MTPPFSYIPRSSIFSSQHKITPTVSVAACDRRVKYRDMLSPRPTDHPPGQIPPGLLGDQEAMPIGYACTHPQVKDEQEPGHALGLCMELGARQGLGSRQMAARAWSQLDSSPS